MTSSLVYLEKTSPGSITMSRLLPARPGKLSMTTRYVDPLRSGRSYWAPNSHQPALMEVAVTRVIPKGHSLLQVPGLRLGTSLLADGGRVPEAPASSELINQAYDILLQNRIVEITRHLSWDSRLMCWTFECVATVPYPNVEKVPEEVRLLVQIDEAFPLTPVEFYPLCNAVSGFPHQDAASNRLCLEAQDLAPRNARRLLCYVRWARDWLVNAANGTLLRPGDPYELPAFTRAESLASTKPLLFRESEESYHKWTPYIGESGAVECALGRNVLALCPTRFLDSQKMVVQEIPFSPAILMEATILVGQWLILPSICYARHRPPRTFGEISELCSSSGIDFYDILNGAWQIENRSPEIGLVLVGFPIPRVCGEDPREMHWQPLLFPNLRAEWRARKKRGQSRKALTMWRDAQQTHFSVTKGLPWCSSTNIAHNRLYARGAHSSALQSMHTAVFGCGALGSMIAELLVRGGVTRLSLFDSDVVELGNLCRHTLDGSSLSSNKATALSSRLSSTNPLSRISGFPLRIPLTSYSPQEAKEAVSEADLLVDCTTSDAAFEWLDQVAIAGGKRMISMFLSFGADFLTLCMSGAVTPCGEVWRDFLACLKRDELPIDPEDYLYQPSKRDQIIPGAGCWHPTFPAPNSHIHLLAATAVDLINCSFRDAALKGIAVLIRRNTPVLLGRGPVVETLWMKQYP